MVDITANAFNIVSKLIEKRESLFESHGFVLTEKTVNNLPGGGRFLQYDFRNNQKNLTLSLLFVTAADGEGGGFSANLYNATGGYLNIHDFLQLHGYVAEKLLFTYTKDVPDFPKYVESFLSMLDRVFSNQLKPILAGEAWESTPIDWLGYK